MAARTSGLVLGLVVFLSTAAVAQAPPSLQTALRRAHAAYVEGRAARDVPRLAIVDGDLRALMAARRLVSVHELRPGYEELGLRPALFESEYLTYTGKVLRDAHAIDPHSPARPFTLFALVFPNGEDGWELPDAAAGRAYLREFPDGPFAAETHAALARLYFDLFQILSANKQSAAGKRECFQRYLTTGPPAAQRVAARRHGLAHYQNAVALRPRDRQLRSEMQALAAGAPTGGHYCSD